LFWRTIMSCRITSVFRQPARPRPVSAAHARGRSTRCRALSTTTSSRNSTSMLVLHSPRSPAVWPSPFLTARASPISITTTLLRRLVLVTPFDRFPRSCGCFFPRPWQNSVGLRKSVARFAREPAGRAGAASVPETDPADGAFRPTPRTPRGKTREGARACGLQAWRVPVQGTSPVAI
jgi:hypothetical protein